MPRGSLPCEAMIGRSSSSTRLPAGFEGPRIFAIVKVDDLRIFTVLRDVDAARVTIGLKVRLAPLRVADDPKGNARWLPAFATIT